MSLIWQAVESHTGRIVADFPDMIASQVTHTLCKYDTSTLRFAVGGDPAPPANWFEATTDAELSAAIVASDASSETPQWAGLIAQRTRTFGQGVQLSCATPEYYLSRRFIRAVFQRKQIDRLQIAADLFTTFVAEGAYGLPSLPIRLEIDGIGELGDADYKDSDDKSIYSAFGELGMEWTFALERLHNPERITHVLRLSERLGSPAQAGLGPQVTFDLPGNLLSAAIVEDYGVGKGGNDIMLSSTGQGSVRPQSDHQVAIGVGRPVVEHRASAGQNIETLATLDDYALQVLQQLRAGAQAYRLTAAQGIAPAFGDRWVLGDDIGFDLQGPEFPDHPAGIGRALGAAWDNVNVTPVVSTEDDGGDDG